MTYKNTKQTYGSVSKFFHWLGFLLILAMLAIGFIMVNMEKSPLKSEVINFHKSTGLLVLFLMLLRTGWTLINPKPASAPGTGFFARCAELIGHFVLYILILILPISGWILSTAAGKIPTFYNLFPVPAPGISQDQHIRHLAGEMHEILAWTIIVIVSLHILIALKHHFINKDNILIRMLPRSNKGKN